MSSNVNLSWCLGFLQGRDGEESQLQGRDGEDSQLLNVLYSCYFLEPPLVSSMYYIDWKSSGNLGSQLNLANICLFEATTTPKHSLTKFDSSTKLIPWNF